MLAGYRVVSPEDVGRWEADLIQISLYRGWTDNLARAGLCAEACVKKGMPFVVHPVGYSLLSGGDIEELLGLSELGAEAMILHDEKAPGGLRLHGPYDEAFRASAGRLSSLVPVSFENATDTADAPWFWSRYAKSVTVDIGHIEAAGFDSTAFVRALEAPIISMVGYVHMHRNGRLRGGLTDHWPLRKGCREMDALAELSSRTPRVSAILEINETEETGESLALIRSLKG